MSQRGDHEAELEEYLKGLELAPDDVWARRKVAVLLRKLRRREPYLQQIHLLAEHYAHVGDDLQLLAMLRLALAEDPGQTISASLSDALCNQPPHTQLLTSLVHPQRSAQCLAPHFSTLSPRSFSAILDRLRLIKCPSDTHIITEGTPTQSLYLVMEGAVGIFRRDHDGDDYLVETVEEGAILGEMELLLNCPALASCQVIEDSLLLELPHAFAIEMMARNGRLCAAIETSYHDRLLSNMQRALPTLRTLSPTQRTTLLHHSHVLAAEGGETLYVPERHDEQLHILLRGTAAPPKESNLPLLTEGAVYGFMADITPRSIYTTLTASAWACVITVQRTAIAQLIKPVADAMHDLQQKIAQTAQPQRRLNRSSHLSELPKAALMRLTAARESGVMVVANPEGEVQLYLQDGRIGWAGAKNRPLAFTRVLKEAGLTAEALKNILSAQKNNPESFADALIEARTVDAMTLRMACLTQISEVISLMVHRMDDSPWLFLPRANWRIFDPNMTISMEELPPGTLL